MKPSRITVPVLITLLLVIILLVACSSQEMLPVTAVSTDDTQQPPIPETENVLPQIEHRQATFYIDRVVCNEAQEDRITDVVSRGDEIYLVYFLMESNVSQRILNRSSQHSAIISDVRDGTELRSYNFPPLTLEQIALDTTVEVFLQINESDDMSHTQELLGQLEDDFSFYSPIQAGINITDFLISTFSNDDVLGTVSASYTPQTIARWADNTYNASETVSNEGQFTSNSYTIYYTVIVEDVYH